MSIPDKFMPSLESWARADLAPYLDVILTRIAPRCPLPDARADTIRGGMPPEACGIRAWWARKALDDLLATGWYRATIVRESWERPA